MSRTSEAEWYDDSNYNNVNDFRYASSVTALILCSGKSQIIMGKKKIEVVEKGPLDTYLTRNATGTPSSGKGFLSSLIERISPTSGKVKSNMGEAGTISETVQGTVDPNSASGTSGNNTPRRSSVAGAVPAGSTGTPTGSPALKRSLSPASAEVKSDNKKEKLNDSIIKQAKFIPGKSQNTRTSEQEVSDDSFEIEDEEEDTLSIVEPKKTVYHHN